MSAPAVVRATIPGKGIGLVAARDIAAGECVVRESRAVLCGVAEAFRQNVCARCLSFRGADGASPPPPCVGCGRVRLCGANGACAWDDLGHGPVACAAETLARDVALARADAERLRFLAACADLRARARLDPARVDAAARHAAMVSLCPDHYAPPPPRELAAAARLRDLLARAAAASPALAPAADAIAGTVAENAALLAKEAHNAFGIMAPATPNDPERRVRGGAVYDLASRVNHDCFPNVARFDNFDGDVSREGSGFPSDPAANAVAAAPDELRLVAIDRIPAGTEITMSYLPVSEPVGRRRRRIRDTFGFSCECERCRLETSWAREDGDPTGDEPNVAGSNPGVGADAFFTAEGEAAAEARAAAAEEAMEEEEDRRAASLDVAERERRADRMPPEFAMWFARNMCPEEGCGGTLAPPNTTADHMTCNYCGRRRTDEEFFRALTGE